MIIKKKRINSDQRIKNELVHGEYISQKGEEVWNWSSPAGRIRWKRRCDMFREFLGNSGKKVLEIGCGTGLFTGEISKTANKITAIDISPALLDLAKRQVDAPNVEFMVKNAYNTGFENFSFDCIVGSSVLHHLDIDRAIREFYRLLKSNGGIMFTEPNMMNPQIAMERNIPFIRKLTSTSPDETAFFRWRLRKKLVTSGFDDVSVIPFDFLHPGVPEFLIPMVKPVLYRIEHIPLLKEIAGSLIIKGRKKIKNQ